MKRHNGVRRIDTKDVVGIFADERIRTGK